MSQHHVIDIPGFSSAYRWAQGLLTLYISSLSIERIQMWSEQYWKESGVQGFKRIGLVNTLSLERNFQGTKLPEDLFLFKGWWGKGIFFSDIAMRKVLMML